MFDDLETAEKKAAGEDTPSPQLYRWAHIPAMLAFVALIIPLHSYRWGWHIAIAGAYTVYVFFFAFGSVLRNADDFFGDPRVPRHAVELLPPHVLVLSLLVPGVSLWFHLRPALPDWATHEGRKESLWDLFGWLALVVAGIVQGCRMARRLKRRFGELED